MDWGDCNARPASHKAPRPRATMGRTRTVSHVRWWPGSRAWWGTALHFQRPTQQRCKNEEPDLLRHVFASSTRQPRRTPSHNTRPPPFRCPRALLLSRLSPYACVTKRARAGLHSTSCPSTCACPLACFISLYLRILAPQPLWPPWPTTESHWHPAQTATKKRRSTLSNSSRLVPHSTVDLCRDYGCYHCAV